MNKIAKIKELVHLLNYYRNEYYNNNNSAISDLEYDQLFDELLTLESETGFIMASSPTQTVGYEVKSELTKVTHNHPMLSLDKTKNIDDVINFLGDQDGICMAKMDGLTCSLRYVNGELVSAETRGNGEIGEDVLHCAKTIKNIPLKIECLDEIIVDGEVIISYDDFEKINSTLPEGKKYKNPRNLASGSIRQLDSSIAAQRNMKFIAWKLVKGWMSVSNSSYMNKNSFICRLELLGRLGFEIVHCVEANKNNVTWAINFIKKECQDTGYPIDGCVFGYDNVIYGDSLGATEHHLKSQYAFKFYDEVYDTKLIKIDWTLGKTGVLTPTAVFEPIEIDGTNVERASLHNVSIIKSLGLTNNCTIRVLKANMIIPQIDSCENDGTGEIAIPKVCPVCGGLTAIKKDNESEVLVCTNPNCRGKKLAQFTHFVSRKCMNIDGLSEATLDKLISLGYINGFKDIYYLFKYYDELVTLDGFGVKSVGNLLLAIEESKNVKLENFIAALGIPNIGLSAAKTISAYFKGSYDEFIGAYISSFMGHFNWTLLDDFGEVMAQSIHNYLNDNFEMIEELAKEMNFIIEEEVSTNKSLEGIVFCITGTFSQNREELKKKLESKGAKFVSSVSKNLDVLFCGKNAGGKLTKAQQLGIKIAYEDELIKMLEE